jgi:peroxiredoxin
MSRLLTALVATLLGACLLSACTGSDAVSTNPDGTFKFAGATQLGKLYPPSDRKPAANFHGTLMNGGTFSLQSTRGKVVVLNFWAAWCAPCKTELPQFDLLYRKTRSQGVDFLGIDTKDVKGNAQRFIANNDISFPSIYDEPGETATRLGNLPSTSLPFTVLIDQSGKVAAVYVIRMSYNDLKAAIDKLLAER